MSTTNEPQPKLVSRAQKALATILIGAVGGLIVFSITEVYRAANARPALEFLELAPGPGYVDLYATSKSSRPFMVHSCQFRVVKVLKEPEPEPAASAGAQRANQPRWLREPIGAAQGTVPNPRGRAIQRIEPEEVVIPPGPLEPGQWITAQLDPAQLDAYNTQRLRCKLPETGRPGAKYLVEARIGYGDKKSPTWETVPQFEIEAAGP